MVFNNENKTEKVVINTCNCGCGSEIQIKRYIDYDVPNTLKEYYISVHSSLFDQEQLGIFRLIGRRLKRVWYDLIGKNYLYLDICMNEEEFNEFIKKLQKLQK